MQPVWAIGLMTGTVIDGFIDIAMLKTDGEHIEAFGPWAMLPYSPQVISQIRQALCDAKQWHFTDPEPASFRQAEQALTLAQATAVKQFLFDHDIHPHDMTVIGFHGQTVRHWPPTAHTSGWTRQLGDGQMMAKQVGIDVVYDLRRADINAGGQGAPLSAIYHHSLLKKIDANPETTAILNLGGVGNITWGTPPELIAFDTGPANAPLNDWIQQHHAGEMDYNGTIAIRGQVNEARLQQLLAHPFLTQPYPKSLDRNDFNASMVNGLSLEAGAATLTALTAATVNQALDLLPRRPQQLIICGGGRKNPHMMNELAKRCHLTPILADATGLRGDAIEAECFAYLAVRALRQLPLSYPSTTGVKQPTSGGQFAPCQKHYPRFDSYRRSESG